jgi:hypothetical protein
VILEAARRGSGNVAKWTRREGVFGERFGTMHRELCMREGVLPTSRKLKSPHALALHLAHWQPD